MTIKIKNKEWEINTNLKIRFDAKLLKLNKCISFGGNYAMPLDLSKINPALSEDVEIYIVTDGMNVGVGYYLTFANQDVFSCEYQFTTNEQYRILDLYINHIFYM